MELSSDRKDPTHQSGIDNEGKDSEWLKWKCENPAKARVSAQKTETSSWGKLATKQSNLPALGSTEKLASIRIMEKNTQHPGTSGLHTHVRMCIETHTYMHICKYTTNICTRKRKMRRRISTAWERHHGYGRQT